MSRLIFSKANYFTIEYDYGSFDNWCVFLSQPGIPRYAPKDVEYFNFFKNAGEKLGHAKIYNDFVNVYTHTSAIVKTQTLTLISNLAVTYEDYATDTEKWFMIIYAGMVAEENKLHAILKKRIKRLGMHQLLLENYSPEEAATFSKNKNWQELDQLMRSKGF